MRKNIAAIAAIIIVIFFGTVACGNAQPQSQGSKQEHHQVTLQLTGSSNVQGLWVEGQRTSHQVNAPFKVTLPVKYNVYGITASLLSEATDSGDLVTKGNLTATVLIDGKIVKQDKTTPDDTQVSAYVYLNANGDFYTIPER